MKDISIYGLPESHSSPRKLLVYSKNILLAIIYCDGYADIQFKNITPDMIRAISLIQDNFLLFHNNVRTVVPFSSDI